MTVSLAQKFVDAMLSNHNTTKQDPKVDVLLNFREAVLRNLPEAVVSGTVPLPSWDGITRGRVMVTYRNMRVIKELTQSDDHVLIDELSKFLAEDPTIAAMMATRRV